MDGVWGGGSGFEVWGGGAGDQGLESGGVGRGVMAWIYTGCEDRGGAGRGGGEMFVTTAFVSGDRSPFASK